MEGEGGGEDEGGEGVALREQTEGEEPTSAWKNFASTLIDLQFIQFKPKAIARKAMQIKDANVEQLGIY